MKKVQVRVPMRADFAGGTLDLWPLYLFQPEACTINLALSLHALVEISETDESGIELISQDQEHHRFDSIADLVRSGKLPLISTAVEHFGISSLRINTRSEAPRGSGLGGSSAVAIALVRGLSEIAGEPIDGDDLIHLVRDLETRVLGVPAGIQDYYPPVYGGLSVLQLAPGRVTRRHSRFPLAQLAGSVVIYSTGVAHFSGENNWQIYRKAVDGDRGVRKHLAGIATAAAKMDRALESGDLPGAGTAMAEEWAHRKQLIRGVSTPEVDEVITAAMTNGAWGGKVCGAGGGGCVVLLIDPESRDRVLEALSSLPGEVLAAAPVGYGMSVETGGTSRTRATSRKNHGEEVADLEQLFLLTRSTNGASPFLLLEGAVTFDDAREGIHHIVERTLAVPLHPSAEIADWQKAVFVEDPPSLPLSRETDSEPPRIDSIMLIVKQSEEPFRAFLQEAVRLPLFHNQDLGIFSKPRESRDEFEQRCLELARQESETQSDALESTFRRRIDQVRERFEREVREAQESLPESKSDGDDSGISWGQMLHDLLSGRTVRNPEPRSPQQADFMEKIVQLQRSWDRDRLELEESLVSRAAAIEEVSLAPNPRGIELRRRCLVWAPSIDAFRSGS